MLKILPFIGLLYCSKAVAQVTTSSECVQLTLQDTRQYSIYVHAINIDDCSLIYQICSDTTDTYTLIELLQVEAIKTQNGTVLYKKGQPCGKNLLNIKQEPQEVHNWWSNLQFSLLSFFISL